MKRIPIIASLLLLPTISVAQPVTGLYVGAGVGPNILQNESATLNGPPGSPTNQLFTRVGPSAVLSLGWGFGNGLRAEVEGDYRYNRFSGASGQSSTDSSGGSEQKFGGMVNVLYDFTNIAPWVQPYIGAGVGYQAARQDGHAFVSGTTLTTPAATQGSFAYQAILGVAFPIVSAPGLAVTAEYRFLGLTGHRSYPSTISLGGGAAMPATLTSNNDYNHAFLVGVRYNFGVSPPPPSPAPVVVPAQSPARSYLVFFDWDKATLTDRARQIIAEAAANSTKVQYTRIEVNGYTDTSGTHQYNMGLSIRRAKAVQAELIKDGVPASAIAIQGFGDTHLLVPTGPGVREPQNRRVEIVVR
jgi:OOP family OmpA-OmpF porin